MSFASQLIRFFSHPDLDLRTTWLVPKANSDHGDVSLLPVLTIFILTSFVCFFCLKTRKAINPPGPRGLPIVGSLPFLDPALPTYFSDLAHKYGPVLKIMLGGKVGIVVSSPSAAREVLRDHDVTFANRDRTAAARAVTYGGMDIAWASYGPHWRMLRKVCTLKMFTNATLDSVYGLRRREIRETVRYFYKSAGSPVNVGEQMFLTILNVITSMIWGGTVQGEVRASIASEFRKVISEITDLLGKPNLSDFFPFLARFDLQGIEKQMNGLAERLDAIFDKLIEQRQRTGEQGRATIVDGGVADGTDFLQFLLKLKCEEDAKTPLTMVSIKALLMDMVVGGTDTSANTVEFAIAEVMSNPHVLARVHQELDTVVGKDKIVEESHISKLPYLRAVMKESLRLHPPIPLLVPHCPSEDSLIGGFIIPKGSRVFINVWAIQHNPTLWENPVEFDPGRFLGSKHAGDYIGNDFSYLPFGSGRRICVGIAMAERMVLYSLATLFHSFDWTLPEGVKMDLSEQFGIVLKKKVPLTAIPTPKLSDPALYE